MSTLSLSQWCAARLGSPIARVLWQAGHLSQVVAVALEDNRKIVVKTRVWQDRLAACSGIQLAVTACGFPAPRVLVASERVGGDAVSAEELVEGGDQLPPDDRAAAAYAALLGRLVALTSRVPAVSRLQPSPPWVGWDHQGANLWPARDTPGPALDDHSGPAWVDDAGAAARTLLAQIRLPLTLGHADWESQNLRWTGRDPHIVHDWDSLVAQPEPAIVGAAAAVWPAGSPGRHAATVEESAAFLDAYRSATGTDWDRRTHQIAWAAGLWLRAFNAKKDAADGGGIQLDLLASEIGKRRRFAGL
jgi:hypothetical protein